MGNCSSTGSRFNQSRFFKATVLDSDCSIGNSTKELGHGNLEVTLFELVLHQKGVQSIRWPHCRIAKYASKGDIFILETTSVDGSQKEKRFFLVRGANVLCKRLHDVDNSHDKRAGQAGTSRSEDGAAQLTRENAGTFNSHGRMPSHLELDLAINHYPLSHHPQLPSHLPLPPQNPAYCYNYGQYQQVHFPSLYGHYPNPVMPHQNFINGTYERPTDQWPQIPRNVGRPWMGQEERPYPDIRQLCQEEGTMKEAVRQQVSLALRRNPQGANPKDQQNYTSMQRRFDALDLDTSNWKKLPEDDDENHFDC